MTPKPGSCQKIQKLTSRIQELETELDGANNRYSRHTAMADMGFQDAEIRDLVEWQYEKAMKSLDKKDQITLGDWLQQIKDDPSTAPVTLRPHIKTTPDQATPPDQEAAPQVVQEAAPGAVQDSPVILPPKTNTGTVQAPVQSTDLLKRAADDFDFYRENRDAIRKAWRGR